ncbi:hypothetical protein E8E13_001680 [Curvularia kusanoi]|uniref:Splicing factor RBM39 linker domain-containing protein n=1 Tax=Curvularia kusanoi TaxID=90978 RepID=A0A9P4T6A5_CURKU|nr:hypothetical protein E8E13_001680 [Curvularia kusanoi]
MTSGYFDKYTITQQAVHERQRSGSRRGAYAGDSGGVFDRTHSKDDRGVSGASALDDTDVAGVNFKTYDRSKLMDALARRDPAEACSERGKMAARKRGRRRMPYESSEILEQAKRSTTCDVEETREQQANDEARDSDARKDDRNGDRRDRHSDRRDRSRDLR